MKIVILDGYTENPGDLSWGGFEALGELTVYDRTPFADGTQEIMRRAKGAEIVITNKTPISAETLAALAPELRYIGVLATGYNVVDVAAAAARGIPVCNIPTYGTTAVAQFVMALLLELCHHVGDHSRTVRQGDWSRCPDFCYWNTPLVELAGKTFGVIGYEFPLLLLFYIPSRAMPKAAQAILRTKKEQHLPQMLLPVPRLFTKRLFEVPCLSHSLLLFP